ncbi:MAG: hypothetical protein WAW85_13855 [Gordonia sp. (in: high G+C Gram-positive bacteria)]|uniref:hypothetical protein n=1 Tax=Gordonia sp. (in: high G+C Gram-positive bacteria) TaxID=84139 RepID=UPI003BB78D9F
MTESLPEPSAPELSLPEPSLPEPAEAERIEGRASAAPSVADQVNGWAKKVLIGVGGVALVIIAYFILAAFLPRWWAGHIGSLVDGSFTRGTSAGLLYGAAGTAITLVLLILAGLALATHRRVAAAVLAGIGVLASIPNLLTLSVVAGTSNSAHAGERIFDVEAPAFRGATLLGVLLGFLIGAAIGFFIYRYRSRGRRLAEAQAALDAQQTPPD